ncbi:MAG: hypothetical protein ACLGIG_09285 [Actinomycetes bacterium]
MPAGVPYASAPTQDWVNVPVLSEVLFHLLYSAGADTALWLAHAVACVAGLAITGVTARRAGASPGAAAVVTGIVLVGGASTFAVARLQMWSIVLLPLLVAFLTSQHRRPDQRIWLLVPLLALWSNLHGAALVGYAVAGAYLLLERARVRPAESAAVILASGAALFATPALWRTVEYYLGVATNESARMHVGLWARLSPDQPLDIAFGLSVLVLLWLGRRYRPSLWEAVAMAGLVLLTASAARNGVWLLLFVAPRVASVVRLPARRHTDVVATAALLAALVIGGTAVVRGPAGEVPSSETIDAAVRLSHTCDLYADGQLGEHVAVAGGRVVIANPLDAYLPEDQRRYLEWLGSGDVSFLPPDVDAVFVSKGSRAADMLSDDARFELVRSDASTEVYAAPSCAPAH